MTQFYDDMLKAAEGIETGFEFYTKEIIPGTWEELPHGQKCTYGKWFAEDVRAGKVKGVVIIDDSKPHKRYVRA